MSYFSESQNMDQWWVRYPLYIITIWIIGMFGYALVEQLYYGKPWGNNPASDLGLILMAVLSISVCIGVLLLITFATLETKVTKYGFEYRYRPFVNSWQKIDKSQIERWTLVKYSPIWEYGGYGIRLRGLKDRAYNAKGNQGLKLTLSNGHRKLFGTQQPDALKSAMSKMMEDQNKNEE